MTAYAPFPATAPSTRYRLAQLAGPLEAVGIELALAPFVPGQAYADLYARGVLRKASMLARGLARRLREIEADDADLALVHRELAPAFNRLLLRRLLRRDRPLVFDFDDAVYLDVPGGHPLLRPLRRPGADTRRLCRAATEVMAGNEHLAEWAREVRGSRERVHVVPTVVDTDRFRPAPRDAAAGALPIVGWVGTHTSLPYLEALEPMLAQARERRPFRLMVVANRPPRLRLEHEFVAWTPETEVERVQRLDVGLYPLPDDAWTRGKCGFKAIQYMACGVPVVASPVGMLQDLVTPGETGFLPMDAGAWEEGLIRLLDDEAARRDMGERARERVVRDYSVASQVDRVAGILRMAVGGREGTP